MNADAAFCIESEIYPERQSCFECMNIKSCFECMNIKDRKQI